MAIFLWIGGAIALIALGIFAYAGYQYVRSRREPAVASLAQEAAPSGIPAPVQSGLPEAAAHAARPQAIPGGLAAPSRATSHFDDHAPAIPLAGSSPHGVSAGAMTPADEAPRRSTSRPWRGGPVALRQTLGRGTHGATYVGEQEVGHKPVVVKRVPHADPGVQQLMEQAGHVHNDHLSHLVYTQQKGSELVAVREHADGLDCLARSDQLHDPRLAAHIMVQVLDALASLHAEGAVHGDLKPTNVIVDRHAHVTVVDAGLVDYADIRALLHAHDEPTRLLLAEPLPPERIRGGPATPAGDIYAAGALLYRLLTGESHLPPGDGSIAAIRDSITNRQLRLPHHNVPHSFDAILRRALSAKPQQRYARASDMALAIQRAAMR